MGNAGSLEGILAGLMGRRQSPDVLAMANIRVLPTGANAALADRESTLVYLASGATKLVAHAAAGREQVTAFNFAGDMVLVPGGGPHRYSLQALSRSALVTMPYRALRKAIAEDPALLALLLDNSDAALARCREKALMIGRKTASERLAGFLVMMAARIGRTEEGRTVITLPMSRRDIGDSLGLTIETVSRQFALLRREGQVATPGRGAVVLLDPAGLQQRAGHLEALGSAFSSKFALDQCSPPNGGLGGQHD